MTRLLSMLAGWHGYAAAAVLSALLASGATFYFTSLSYRLTISKMETENATASAEAYRATLDQLAVDAQRIHEAAGQHGEDVAALGRKFNAISKDLRNAISANPLPDACPALDAGRLSALKAATDAANSAAGHGAGSAVSGNP